MKYLMYGALLMMAVCVVPIISSVSDNNKSIQMVEEKNHEYKKSRKDLDMQVWHEDWSDEDMMQHPIDETPRKVGRELGEMCSYSSDCNSGCCLLDRETKIRSCQGKSLRGEKCTAAQVKGDLYVDACPCLAGNDFCAFPGEFCTK